VRYSDYVSKSKAVSQRQAWINGWHAQECCGLPMQTGFDTMTLQCRHVDYTPTETVALYAMCDGACGTTEVLCEQCITEAVKDANS